MAKLVEDWLLEKADEEKQNELIRREMWDKFYSSLNKRVGGIPDPESEKGHGYEEKLLAALRKRNVSALWFVTVECLPSHTAPFVPQAPQPDVPIAKEVKDLFSLLILNVNPDIYKKFPYDAVKAHIIDYKKKNYSPYFYLREDKIDATGECLKKLLELFPAPKNGASYTYSIMFHNDPDKQRKVLGNHYSLPISTEEFNRIIVSNQRAALAIDKEAHELLDSTKEFWPPPLGDLFSSTHIYTGQSDSKQSRLLAHLDAVVKIFYRRDPSVKKSEKYKIWVKSSAAGCLPVAIKQPTHGKLLNLFESCRIQGRGGFDNDFMHVQHRIADNDQLERYGVNQQMLGIYLLAMDDLLVSQHEKFKQFINNEWSFVTDKKGWKDLINNVWKAKPFIIARLVCLLIFWTYSASNLFFGTGMRFAQNELRIGLAHFVLNYRVEAERGMKLEYFRGSVLMSPKSLMVRIRARWSDYCWL